MKKLYMYGIKVMIKSNDKKGIAKTKTNILHLIVS